MSMANINRVAIIIFCLFMSTTLFSFAVGDKCPAGGIIFYDKGDDSDGWQYLSAAPASSEFTAQWSRRYLDVVDTGAEIGTGKSNTEKIVAFLTENGETNSVAHKCVALEIGGFSDWFLPSKEELNLMHTVLKRGNKDKFQDEGYWSSTQLLPEKAWLQVFMTGRQYGFDKNHTDNVRAIRAF